MPNIASAAKKMRQADRARLRNRKVKSSLHTLSLHVTAMVEQRNIDGAKKALVDFSSAIDRASSNGVVHKNTASRKIARLQKKVNALSPVQK
ncbi:MAG: 30S ribosomal protein S20 [Spirochaetes bacterium]|nr:30S ribosomal protein S20 [Spirochaetota bacterium]